MQHVKNCFKPIQVTCDKLICNTAIWEKRNESFSINLRLGRSFGDVQFGSLERISNTFQKRKFLINLCRILRELWKLVSLILATFWIVTQGLPTSDRRLTA